MSFIECTDSAYKRLEAFGLIHRICNDTIRDQMLSAYFDYTNGLQKIFKKAEKVVMANLEKISERRIVYEEILKLKHDLENGSGWINRDEVIKNYPGILAFMALGEDVLNYKSYEFPTRRALEEAVSGFCVGEWETAFSLSKENYIWRRNGLKNRISNAWHGDLYVGQVNVFSEEKKEEGLFESTIYFDSLIDSEYSAILAHYDSWPFFLVGVLKYAEAMGKKNIPEIIDWREVIKKVGYASTYTAEAEFGSQGNDFLIYQLKEGKLLIGGKRRETYNDLSIVDNSNCSYTPCLLDSNLAYVRRSKEGESFFCEEDLKYSKVLTYSEEDLPDLLAGTYRLFARDRSQLPKIMDMFLNRS